MYRHQGPVFKDGESASFLTLNRGKRSVALDLGSDSDRSATRGAARRQTCSSRTCARVRWRSSASTTRPCTRNVTRISIRVHLGLRTGGPARPGRRLRHDHPGPVRADGDDRPPRKSAGEDPGGGARLRQRPLRRDRDPGGVSAARAHRSGSMGADVGGSSARSPGESMHVLRTCSAGRSPVRQGLAAVLPPRTRRTGRRTATSSSSGRAGGTPGGTSAVRSGWSV